MSENARQVQRGDADVASIIRSAWAAVSAAQIPEALHVAAFNQAVVLLSGSRAPQVASLGTPGGSNARNTNDLNKQVAPVSKHSESDDAAFLVTDEDAFFALFASESRVDEEKLRKVYFVKEGRPRIALTKSKLGSTEAERNRAVATLLAGIRWYVESKASVMIGEIRNVAEAIPYEVTRNLSTHLDGVAGTITVGAKKDKAVRVQSGKFDEPFSALIEKLVAN